MIISGIADEAAPNINTQIRAHQQLSWQAIDLRLVDGKNVCSELPDDDFDCLADKIDRVGLQVTCLASAIGNWARPITGDFQLDLQELQTAIPRMHRLRTRFLRTMSWTQADADEATWRRETIRRYREMTRIAADADIILAHENCTGWASLSPDHTRELYESLADDHFVVLFDMGSSVSHGRDAWEYYLGVRDLIRYVHIKDCRFHPDRRRSHDYTFPGDGHGRVRDILTDLLTRSYDGTIAIEPHVATIIHDSQNALPHPEELYDSYIRYGQTLTLLIEDIREKIGGCRV